MNHLIKLSELGCIKHMKYIPEAKLQFHQLKLFSLECDIQNYNIF